MLVYASDTGTGACKSLNWSIVKRYIAAENFVSAARKEYCVSVSDRQTLFRAVLTEKIYPEKRSAALCLALNFYLGLRIGELAGLRWQDVNFAEQYVYTSHKIRKTFASELHRNGAPTKMISEIMGHAEMRTTERSYIVSYTDTLDVMRDFMQKGLMAL